MEIASVYLPLSGTLAIPLSLTILGIGLLLVFLGFSLVLRCSDPGGCHPEPLAPLVALGISFGLVGAVMLLATLRLKPKTA